MLGGVIVNLVKVAAVFALLFVTLRMLGTWNRGRGGVRTSARAKAPLIEKIDELRVGRGGSVVTLRVGDTVLLLGVTEQHVQQIADVTASVDLTEMDAGPRSGAGPSPFEHALALLRDRVGDA